MAASDRKSGSDDSTHKGERTPELAVFENEAEERVPVRSLSQRTAELERYREVILMLDRADLEELSVAQRTAERSLSAERAEALVLALAEATTSLRGSIRAQRARAHFWSAPRAWLAMRRYLDAFSGAHRVLFSLRRAYLGPGAGLFGYLPDVEEDPASLRPAINGLTIGLLALSDRDDLSPGNFAYMIGPYASVASRMPTAPKRSVRNRRPGRRLALLCGYYVLSGAIISIPAPIFRNPLLALSLITVNAIAVTTALRLWDRRHKV